MSWADSFNTYEDACNFFGADTPASLAAESAYYEAEEWNEHMDRMEAGLVMPGAYFSADLDTPF